MAGESASFDDQDDLNASFIKIQEHGDEELSEEIAGMIEYLDTLPASSPKRCCIYMVPNHIRESNEEAYNPQVISIGRFHHGKIKLLEMEMFKSRYFKSFTDRAETKLEDIVSTIKGAEESVRECYNSENLPFSSYEFVKMILVDASFIIEYFWKNKTKVNWTDYDREILEPWLWNRVQMDLILLENQLPFFIIEKIYDTAFPSLSKVLPFIELSFCQFQYYNVQEFDHHDPDRDFGSSGIFILHFTDFHRHFCMPPRERRPEGSSELSRKEMHSATQLDGVQLKFKISKPGNNCSPLELKYADGVLEIPPFELDATTEIYARNLFALEKCHYPKEEAYITDYYTLLSFLIKTGKDLDVLVREQIIDNWLDGTVATSMIKKLSGEKRFYIQMNSDYHKLAKKLNEFYTARVGTTYHKIIMILKRDYFCNPWRGAATMGGILLLLLTVTQTVCALISLKN